MCKCLQAARRARDVDRLAQTTPHALLLLPQSRLRDQHNATVALQNYTDKTQHCLRTRLREALETPIMPTLVPASPSSIDVDDDSSDAPPSPPRRRHQLDLQSTGEIAAPTTRRDVWVVAATTVGNALEWYDFALFGFLAPELATGFFPPKNHLNSALLETFLVFGAAFLVRPVGGLAMGAFSDRHGRKRALQLSVIAMSGATASIGLLPTYAMAGSRDVPARALPARARPVRGGGQLTGALVYLVESAPPGHEHLFGSLAFASGNAGTMLGGVAVAFVQTRAGQDAFAGHGWRYPFLLSAFLGWGGYYIQSYAEESPEYLAVVDDGDGGGRRRQAAAEPARAPADRRNSRAGTRSVAPSTPSSGRGRRSPRFAAACILSPAAFLRFFVFAPAFYPLPQATVLATRCLLLSVLALPLAGAADRTRRRATGVMASRPTPPPPRRSRWAWRRRRSSRASPPKTRTPPRWA